MKLLQKGQRLSVMPVTKEEFEKIRSLGIEK
jgi:predicted RNA-binding protein with PUA-like domain